MFRVCGVRDDGSYYDLEVWRTRAQAEEGLASYRKAYPDCTFLIVEPNTHV